MQDRWRWQHFKKRLLRSASPPNQTVAPSSSASSSKAEEMPGRGRKVGGLPPKRRIQVEGDVNAETGDTLFVLQDSGLPPPQPHISSSSQENVLNETQPSTSAQQEDQVSGVQSGDKKRSRAPRVSKFRGAAPAHDHAEVQNYLLMQQQMLNYNLMQQRQRQQFAQNCRAFPQPPQMAAQQQMFVPPPTRMYPPIPQEEAARVERENEMRMWVALQVEQQRLNQMQQQKQQPPPPQMLNQNLQQPQQQFLRPSAAVPMRAPPPPYVEAVRNRRENENSREAATQTQTDAADAATSTVDTSTQTTKTELEPFAYESPQKKPRLSSYLSIVSTGSFVLNNSSLLTLNFVPPPQGAQQSGGLPALPAPAAPIKPDEEASDCLSPDQYLDELEMVSQFAAESKNQEGHGKYIYEFYKYVTKVQIMSDGRPISFRLFRKMYYAHELDELEKRFLKYWEDKKKMTDNGCECSK